MSDNPFDDLIAAMRSIEAKLHAEEAKLGRLRNEVEQTAGKVQAYRDALDELRAVELPQ